jgi:hypothetical protein
MSWEIADSAHIWLADYIGIILQRWQLLGQREGLLLWLLEGCWVVQVPNHPVVVRDVLAACPTGEPCLFGRRGTLGTAALNQPVLLAAEEEDGVATDPTDATVHTVIIMPPLGTNLTKRTTGNNCYGSLVRKVNAGMELC